MRISRIYVDHFGAPTGWYQKTIFDLCDPVTGQPTDACINLENAGGKTSLLSYIFSCFDPDKKNWIQTLQSKTHLFKDYFARDGRPSFIVIEAIMPARNAGGSEYRLIVGQAVIAKETSDRGADTDRRHFCFEDTGGLCWEDLPVPNISMAPVKTWNEFINWANHPARLKSRGDFFMTSNQGEWMTHLEDRRLVDLELLKMQVQFNKSEGGSSDGLLTFNNETDLIAKILHLCMNLEQTTELRNVVGQAVDNLKAKPRHESRLEQMLRLQQAMDPFSSVATQMVGASKALASGEQRAVNVSAAIRSHMIELEAEISTSSAGIGDYQEIANKALAASQEAAQDHIAAKGLGLKRAEALALSDFNSVSKESTSTELYKTKLHAAIDRKEIEGLVANLQDLERKKDSITLELAPLETDAANNGAMLRFELNRQIQKISEAIVLIDQQRAALTAEVESIDERNMDLNKRNTALGVEKGQIRGIIESARKVHDDLIKNGHLLATDITVSHAVDRMTLSLEEAEARLEELKSIRNEKSATLEEARIQAADISKKLNFAKESQDPLIQYLKDHELESERLRNLPMLIEITQGTCDLRSLVLISDIQHFIEVNRSEISSRDVRLSLLDQERESIEQTGLSGRNPDVDQVVAALKKAGLRSARAANTYLADLRPVADEARALILSDPGRYLGVNIAKDEWAPALELVNAMHLELSAPVTLAVASLSPTMHDHDKVVLSPYNDAAFNHEAAEKALARFEATIATTKRERDDFIQRDKLAQMLLGDVQRFSTTYAHIQVTGAETQLESLRGQVAESEEAHAAIESEIEALKRGITGIGDQIEQLPGQISNLNHGIKQLVTYLENWAEAQEKGERRLDQIDPEIANIMEKLKANYDVRTLKEDQSRSLSLQQADLKSSLKLVQAEQSTIHKFSDEYDAGVAINLHGYTLESLRTRYSDSIDLLSAAEADKLGLIGFQLRTARKQLDTAEATYSSRYPHLPAESLVGLMDLDHSNEIRLIDKKLSELSEKRELKRGALSDAKSSIGAFWESRERVEPSDEMLALADDDLKNLEDSRLEQSQIKQAEHLAASESVNELKGKTAAARRKVDDLKNNLKNLEAAFDRKQLVAEEIELGDNVEEAVSSIVNTLRTREREVAKLKDLAGKAYQGVVRIVGRTEFAEAEGQIAEIFASADLEAACESSEEVSEMVLDRISAYKGSLEGLIPDFERCVTEIYNQVSAATTMLKNATSMNMPVGTPYVSGKPILKMNANLGSMSVDQRKLEIRQYLNGLIENTLIPATGAEIITKCLLMFTPHQTFGLQILKMEENIEFQYQAVNNMKKSAGQGTVIAMFLYMLVSYLRVDTQAKAMRGGGGPLLLDNPFANVQTRALIDAQRMLASALNIQLICLTANADANIIEGFRRVLRLRKAGMQKRSSRTYIEMASATFEGSAGKP